MIKADVDGAPLKTLSKADVTYLAQVAQDNDWEHIEHMAIDELETRQ